MFYVYVLKSKINGNLYIGFAPDLRERFKKHNAGMVQSTKRYIPWKLIYYEAYIDKNDAIKREQQLKRFAKSFSMLKRRIKNSLMLQG